MERDPYRLVSGQVSAMKRVVETLETELATEAPLHEVMRTTDELKRSAARVGGAVTRLRNQGA